MKTDNLTKDEAIQAMKEGHKVAHRYFSDDEWMTLDGLSFLTEDGCRHDPYIFWIDRQSPEWNTDWRVVVPEIDTLKQSNKEMLDVLRLVLKTGSGPEETFIRIKNAITNAEGNP